MSKCDLTIVLDEPGRTVAIGDTVSGEVRVGVDKDCRCDGLVLAFGWATHGRGNGATSEQGVVRELFRGKWRAGENLSYRFELEVQPGPIMYHGFLLNVDYYLCATADIPWAFDPSTEKEVIVTLGKDPSAFRVDDDGAQLSRGGSARADPSANAMGAAGPLVMLVLAALAVGGAVAVCLGLSELVSGNFGGLMAMLFGLIFGAAGAGILYMMIRNQLAERKLGQVDAEVTPGVLSPGEELTVQLGFTPQGIIQLNGLTATLTGAEVVISGSGTDRTTHTHELFEEKVTLHGGGSLGAGRPCELAHGFCLPDDAPYSFAATDNRINWTVDLHIDIAKWPDWTQTIPITVVPS